MENRRKEKEAEAEANKPRPPPEGITPSKLGMKRDSTDTNNQNLVELTTQVYDFIINMKTNNATYKNNLSFSVR